MTTIKRRYGSTWRVLSPIVDDGEGGPEPTVPMAPTNVQASSSVGGQATVSWTPPADNGGSSITGYAITTTRVSDGTSNVTNVGAVVSTIITDLVSGELYEFTAQAVNTVGLSSASTPPAQVIIPGGTELTMPTAATVGPRQAPNRTLSAAQALDELRNTGYLSRVTVTGTFGLSGSDGMDWVIEDCRFEAGSTYAVRGYTSGGAFTGTQVQRPVFRYCELVGAAAHSGGTSASNACVYGDDIIFEHTDMYGGADGVKARNRIELRYSWVHDLDHPSGAHCDAVQIVSGTGSVFLGNRFDAYVGYSSDGSLVPDGSTGNGVLQTGAVTNNISALWDHNWFAGGHYTIRGAGSDARVEYTFRNNRFLRYGTSVALGLTNLQPNRYGTTYGGVTTNEVWENNVWDDTEELIT